MTRLAEAMLLVSQARRLAAKAHGLIAGRERESAARLEVVDEQLSAVGLDLEFQSEAEDRVLMRRTG